MKGCKTCTHASFQKTASGRIKHAAGRCLFPITQVVIPICVHVEVNRTAIWPDYGADCPTWQAKAA